jgi:putative chitinase
MIPIGTDTLRQIVRTKGDRVDRVIEEIGPVLGETLAAHGIDTPLRVAHFLAQLCYESGGFQFLEEPASGDEYAGRRDLGNTGPGDGQRYKGRGFIQITGRSNYTAYSEMLGLDLLNNPRLAAEPRIALRIACVFWERHRLNDAADRDDILVITRRINGGLNGLEDRKAYLARSKAALSLNKLAPGAPEAPKPAPSAPTT